MIDLTARLVAAYLGSNTLKADEIPNLIRSTYAALISASLPPAEDTPILQPAVPIKKSITNAAIFCLECGRKFSIIKRHLRTDHGMTPDEYRAKWSLPFSYPLVAPDYTVVRSAQAKKSGLGKPRTKITKAAAPVKAEKPKRGSRPKVAG